MDAESTLMILRQTAASATMQDALAFLSICEDRGLSPFVEASPLIQDYTKSNGQKVHSLAIKEHYAVQERWAQQCGGYIVYKSEVEKTADGIIARVWVVANRDYAAVGKLAAMIPTLDFKEELARFTVCGEATVTQSEMNRKAPATKTWEWVATKRAREGALRQKFGKEPSQARQMYTAALTALSQADLREGIAAMYPQRQALTVAAEPLDVPVIEVITDPEPAPAAQVREVGPEPAHWIDDPRVRAGFWARMKELGLSNSDVYQALDVVSVHDYPGSKDDAKAAIQAYIERNTQPGDLWDQEADDAQPTTA